MNGAFGHAYEVASLIGGDGQLKGPRIGEADILAGKPRDPARDIKGILPGLQHPCKPVYGGVGVRVAHRLVQGRNEIIMLLAVFIVKQRLLRHALLERLLRDSDTALTIHFTV